MSRASEWAERGRERAPAEAEELELPSGAKIMARRPDAAQLAVWGRMPLQLASAVVQQQSLGTLSGDQVIEMMQFQRDLLLYCCVNPRISMDPKGEDEIHPKDIPQEDWQFITRWAMRFEEGRKLEGFRGERPGDRVGGGGEDVGSAAVVDAGDSGPGVGIEL